MKMDFEELVEVAVAFLEEELLAERGLVIHPDPGQREPVVQGHVGFRDHGLADIDTIRWQWLPCHGPVLVEWQQGRSQISCPLGHGGLLYADHTAARFQDVHLEALLEFAGRYSEALAELTASPAPRELLAAFPNLAREGDAPDIPVPPGLMLVDWL